MANHEFTPIDETIEEWREIPGFEGLYEVSSNGRIRSMRDTTSSAVGRLLSLQHTKYGYVRVTLFRDGKRNRCSVHRLVARAFLGPRPKGKQVNHKNGKKADNRPENIEYVTPSRNLEHARKVLGKKFGNHKLSDKQKDRACELYKTGLYSQERIGKRFGVSGTQIGRILRKRGVEKGIRPDGTKDMRGFG